MIKNYLALFMAVIVCFIFCGCSNGKSKVSSVDDFNILKPQTTSSNLTSEKFDKVAETEELVLSVNYETGNIQVTVKESGYVWTTCANTANDSTTYNLFSINYDDKEGNNRFLKSTADCIANGQYQIENINNGIKMRFSIGNASDEWLFPKSLTPERYEKFYELADDDGKYILEMAYYKIDFAELDEISRKEKEEQYPNAVKGVIYGMRQNNWNNVMQEKIASVFSQVGYTKEDLKIDGENISDTISTPKFDLTINFTIEDNRLMVYVPYSEIKFSSSVYLKTIGLLESFSGSETNDGYFVLPEGSGSIMNFNNGKAALGNYRVKMYGNDYGISTEKKVLEESAARLPIFGCKQGNNAYLAVIEDSDSLSYVNAFPGNETAIPRLWSEYEVLAVDYMTSSSTSSVGEAEKYATYQTKKYNGDIKISYSFLYGEDANYSGMAKLFSDKIFGERVKKSSSYPFNAEIVNVVDIQKKLLGVSVKKNILLTDYSQVEDIATELLNMRIENLSIKMSGWTKDGYRHGDITQLGFDKKIGDKSDLLSLNKNLSKMGVELFPDLDVQYTYSSSSSKTEDDDIIVLLNKKKGKLYSFDLATYEAKTSKTYRNILTFDALQKNMNYVEKFMNELSINSYSFRRLGEDLNSDYFNEKYSSRQDALNLIKKSLDKNSATIMCSGGNAYVLPYVDYLVDTPLRSARFSQTDYDIPFVAMVLSGHINYYSQPVNLSNDSDADILRIIESAAAPNFLITANSSDETNLSEYDFLYSTLFDENKDEIKEIYSKLKGALEDVYGQEIIAHECLQRNVNKVTFESGKWIILNYNLYPIEIGGNVVDSYGYLKGSDR